MLEMKVLGHLQTYGVGNSMHGLKNAWFNKVILMHAEF